MKWVLIRVGGRLNYAGHPLSKEPELVEGDRLIPHGEVRRFCVRQWVSPEVAMQLRAGQMHFFQPGTFALRFAVNRDDVNLNISRTLEEVIHID